MKLALCAAAAVTLLATAPVARAEPSTFYTPGQMAGLCKGFGTYFPPAGSNRGNYGCLMDESQGGGLIICGPAGDLQQVQCDVYAKTPPHRRGHLPTQAALEAAVKADPSTKTPDPNSALAHRFGPGAQTMQKHP